MFGVSKGLIFRDQQSVEEDNEVEIRHYLFIINKKKGGGN